jgi:hypothetical protein
MTSHGWLQCRVCHAPGQDLRQHGVWHLRANPGYWGDSAPKVLLLGFSKGATQIAAASKGEFDSVAFAGAMRPRLRQVLDALRIDLEGQSIDDVLTAAGSGIGAASLIRCGLSLEKDGKLVTSGTIMPKAAKDAFTRQVMDTCVSQHLDPLPASVETIVLLGTTDVYIEAVKQLMRARFADYRDLNPVAFSAQERTWVFAAHPSPANGELKEWLSGDPASASGRKLQWARQALGASPSLSVPVIRAPLLKPRGGPTSTKTDLTKTARAARIDDRFASTFHLVHRDGRKLVPVRMLNRDTGRVAFRVAKKGNTKDGQLEIFDEDELLRLCETGQYQVRVQPLDKSTPASLVRPMLEHRIVCNCN